MRRPASKRLKFVILGIIALSVVAPGCGRMSWVRPSQAPPEIAGSVTTISPGLGATNAGYPAQVSEVLGQTLVVTKYAKNPILRTSDIPWATHYPEHPQIIKVGAVYHMYFHAANAAGYRIGHATASSIAGPWTVDSKLLLDVTPATWESDYVATPYVMQVGNTFYMWYSAYDGSTIRTGLATSTSPDGPFIKDPGNPFQFPSGWVGSVQRVESRYYMVYGSEEAQDFVRGPTPKGPWDHIGRGVPAGLDGSWNRAGSMGEGGVIYLNGLFYMFYAGMAVPADPPDAAMKRPFDIGLAVSQDAVTWYEHSANPIIRRGREGAFDSWRLSEVGAYFENGTFYILYTSIGPSNTLPGDETLSLATVKLIKK